MPDEVYPKLAEHLDKLPGGFPPTPDGLEIRILKRLFTPEEAELAVHLNVLPESAPVIARRLEQDNGPVKERLIQMSRKGLILSYEKPHKEPLFMAAQFVIGIWEFHVNDLDEGLIRDFRAYLPYLMDAGAWNASPQLRTIPVGRSVSTTMPIMAHEQAAELVSGHTKFAVAPCICRKEHAMTGEACAAPLESCLIFGSAAEYYIRNGSGREIDLAECLEILERADRAGLVLQPSNSKKIVNICCCCGCCCQVLGFLKKQPQPGRLVSSPFIASFDPDNCVECGVCIERCQMEAISGDENGGIILDEQSCIGCGLCVSTCPTQALSLQRKSEQEQKTVPRSNSQGLYKLARYRRTMSPANLAGTLVKSKWDRLMTRNKKG
jgi:electron transport complex protein RnfB